MLTDTRFLFRCPLLALSRHTELHRTCPLSGVKRTCLFALHMSAFDPKRTLAAHFEPPFGLIIWRAMIPYLDTWGGNEATRLYWFARRCGRLPIRRARAAGSGRPPYRRVTALCNRQSGKGPCRGVPPGIADDWAGPMAAIYKSSIAGRLAICGKRQWNWWHCLRTLSSSAALPL